jgi:hypothetical protein
MAPEAAFLQDIAAYMHAGKEAIGLIKGVIGLLPKGGERDEARPTSKLIGGRNNADNAQRRRRQLSCYIGRQFLYLLRMADRSKFQSGLCKKSLS